MPRFLSPLRYPGGKGKLGPYFARLLADQRAQIDTYAEPYAGGAGAGLYLLAEGVVDHLLINDLNPGVSAFWRSVVSNCEPFIERLETTSPTIEEWHRQRTIYLNGSADDLTLGFATFFLNRCNRSGILTARPIGGLDQSGRWKIDARFNRADLVSRIRLIADHGSQIRVSQQPAIDFLLTLNRRKKPILLYVDPPYVAKGEELYMSSHSWTDHQDLAAALDRTRHPWILTYDFDERIRRLYSSSRCLSYSISHTAQSQKVAREFMLFGRGLRVGDLVVASGRAGNWVA